MFISYLFNFSDLLESYISLLVWRRSLGLSGWMMLSGARALRRLCVSDFYQGKPIRPDRGMMILDHHHSGDNAPTNPTTPSSIRQPKTPSNAPPPAASFPCFPLTPSPTHSLLAIPFSFPLSSDFSSPSVPDFPPANLAPRPILPYFLCFISLLSIIFPLTAFFFFILPPPPLTLSPSLGWQTHRQILPFS